MDKRFYDMQPRVQAVVWDHVRQDEDQEVTDRMEAAANAITILWSELAAADLKIRRLEEALWTMSR